MPPPPFKISGHAIAALFCPSPLCLLLDSPTYSNCIAEPRSKKNVFFALVDELYAALVLSTKAHARLVAVDPSEALEFPGVIDFVGHRDVPAHNAYRTFSPEADEMVFAENLVRVTTNRASCVTVILQYGV